MASSLRHPKTSSLPLETAQGSARNSGLKRYLEMRPNLVRDLDYWADIGKHYDDQERNLKDQTGVAEQPLWKAQIMKNRADKLQEAKAAVLSMADNLCKTLPAHVEAVSVAINSERSSRKALYPGLHDTPSSQHLNATKVERLIEHEQAQMADFERSMEYKGLMKDKERIESELGKARLIHNRQLVRPKLELAGPKNGGLVRR